MRIRKLDPKGVEYVVLYGSVAAGREAPGSDIDLAVSYRGSLEERFRFRIKAQGALGENFDVQIFQDLPVHVRNEVVTGGKVVFCRDYKRMFAEYMRHIKEYADFKKYLDHYYAQLEKA